MENDRFENEKPKWKLLNEMKIKNWIKCENEWVVKKNEIWISWYAKWVHWCGDDDDTDYWMKHLSRFVCVQIYIQWFRRITSQKCSIISASFVWLFRFTICVRAFNWIQWIDNLLLLLMMIRAGWLLWIWFTRCWRLLTTISWWCIWLSLLLLNKNEKTNGNVSFNCTSTYCVVLHDGVRTTIVI